MGLVYHNGKFLPEEHIQKNDEESELLRRLREFLDENEPGLVYLLVNLWNSQGKAITYKELREAILAGEISVELFKEWQQDYSRFVVKHLQPKWLEAISKAAEALERKYPEWFFNPMADGVRAWVINRAAEFVTNSTNAQIDGLRAIIQRVALLEEKNVDHLARVVRPMIGLTKQQAAANLNYYITLTNGGTSEKRALDLSTRYAARQHRYRGYNIARTELSFAYNQGSYEGTKQAQEAGYMGKVVKIWCTAEDERVCPICGGLEGKEVAMDEDFDFYTKLQHSNPGIRRTPPAHPSCRCAVMYKEIAPPIKR